MSNYWTLDVYILMGGFIYFQLRTSLNITLKYPRQCVTKQNQIIDMVIEILGEDYRRCKIT